MTIFEHSSYKTFLSYLISHQDFMVSDLALMAGCNRSYFSQMLNGKVQLTMDHLINLSEGLNFNELEKEFFVTLGLHERASLLNTRKTLENKLHSLKQKNLVLAKKIKSEAKNFELTNEMKGTYYSHWLYGQIHIMTSIPEFQTPEAIAEKLQLKISQVKKILKELHEMRLVTKKDQHYFHQSQDLHVPAESSYNLINQMNWRMRAIDHINVGGGVHYTSAFSISKKDIPVLQNQLLEFIKKQREIIGKSGTEEMVCFNCDLFESY